MMTILEEQSRNRLSKGDEKAANTLMHLRKILKRSIQDVLEQTYDQFVSAPLQLQQISESAEMCKDG